MKKTKMMLPLIGVGASVLASIPFTASCSQKELGKLIWDKSHGDFVYSESIENTMPNISALPTPEEVTDLYFEAVEKNPYILLYDLVQMFFDYDHAFAFDGIGIQICTRVAPIEYIDSFKATHVEAVLTKWDVKTHRVSFELNANFICDDRDFKSTGTYNFKLDNVPMAFAVIGPGTTDTGNPDFDNKRKSIKTGISNRWTFVPKGIYDFMAQIYPEHGELVDPRWGGGSGSGQLMMCLYDNWSITINEEYKLPKNQMLSFNKTLTPSFLGQMGVSWDIDPEIFNYWRYIAADMYFFESFHYLDNVASEAE